jgi:hypothetical protein
MGCSCIARQELAGCSQRQNTDPNGLMHFFLLFAPERAGDSPYMKDFAERWCGLIGDLSVTEGFGRTVGVGCVNIFFKSLTVRLRARTSFWVRRKSIGKLGRFKPTIEIRGGKSNVVDPGPMGRIVIVLFPPAKLVFN